MRSMLSLLIASMFLVCCTRDTKQRSEEEEEKNNSSSPVPVNCNIEKAYEENKNKVTITAGIWGTVSSKEGTCMPPLCDSCCRHCPVQRTIKIYTYTTLMQAVTTDPGNNFFDSFNSQLVKQVQADTSGFFQADIPPGHYSIVVVEDGKLYAITQDNLGGLGPLTFNGGIGQLNLVMTYKATF